MERCSAVMSALDGHEKPETDPAAEEILTRTYELKYAQEVEDKNDQHHRTRSY